MSAFITFNAGPGSGRLYNYSADKGIQTMNPLTGHLEAANPAPAVREIQWIGGPQAITAGAVWSIVADGGQSYLWYSAKAFGGGGCAGADGNVVSIHLVAG